MKMDFLKTNVENRDLLFKHGDQVSDKTIRCRLTHLNLFLENGIGNYMEYFEKDANQKIDNLVTIRDKKSLSETYKLQIANTIRKFVKNSDVEPKIYKRNVKYKTKPIEPSEIDQVMDVLLNVVHAITHIETYNFTTPALYETCILVLLIACTTARIGSVRKLTLDHLNMILNNQMSISIKNKTQLEKIDFVQNKILTPLIKLIISQRPIYLKMVGKSLKNDLDVKIFNNSRRMVFLYSETTLMSTFKKYCNSLSYNCHGTTVFRTLTTNILVSSGGDDIAQKLNRHKSKDTTLNYYTAINSKELDKVFQSIRPPNLEDLKNIHSGLNPSKTDEYMKFVENEEKLKMFRNKTALDSINKNTNKKSKHSSSTSFAQKRSSNNKSVSKKLKVSSKLQSESESESGKLNNQPTSNESKNKTKFYKTTSIAEPMETIFEDVSNVYQSNDYTNKPKFSSFNEATADSGFTMS